MKRFLISILIFSCLVCSVSAESVLFTPHHVSSSSLQGIDNIKDAGGSDNITFHVDSDGKTHSLYNGGQYSFKLKQKKHDHFSLGCVFLEFDSLIFFRNINFQNLDATYFSLIQRRKILFPFHSFI